MKGESGMIDITVILTCFNRKEKTLECLKSINEGNKNLRFTFIVVDDNSTDGTIKEINRLNMNTIILNGDGSLFWSGGMRKGIEYYINNLKSKFVLFVNDDVRFFEKTIEEIISQAMETDAVIVGATCDNKNNFTYGAIKLNSTKARELYYHIKPEESNIVCDTFNANCVLIKDEIIREIGNFDKVYRHTLADLDYGFMISRKGYKILSSQNYIGICDVNSTLGTWKDKKLSIKERIKKKESIKGAPIKEWFYFLNKNFGFLLAVRYSITPYIRILLKK